MLVGGAKLRRNIVTVIWRDACSKDEWHQAEKGDIPGGAMICSTGFLLHESDQDIVISHTMAPQSSKGDDWDTCCALAIPKGCIYEVYTVPDYEKKLKKVTPIKTRKSRQRRK